MKNNIKALIGMLKQLYYIFDGKQRKRAFIVLFGIMIGAVLEMVGLSAIMPFIQAILAPEQIAQNRFVGWFLNAFHIDTSFGIIAFLGGVVIALYVGKNIYLIYTTYLQWDFNSRIQKELSVKMMKSYLKRPYTFFLDVNSAEILRGVTDDISGIYNIVANVFFLSTESITICMIAIYIVIQEPVMAIGLLAVALLCLIIMTLGFKKKTKILGVAQRNASLDKKRCANQITGGIKEIMVMQRKENFVDLFEDACEVKRVSDQGFGFISNIPHRIIEGAFIGGLIGVVLVRIAMGVNVVTFVPTLGTFAVAAFKILPSLGKISTYISSLVFYKPTLEDVYVNMKKANAYEAEFERYVAKAGVNIEEKELEQQCFDNQVTINHVDWKYDKAEKKVLSDLSLSINKGESIALIGASGAGKTTLADMILGLLHPQNGSIEMDGRDVYAMPKTWARIIGYVPQFVFLTDDTIRNNISFGVPADELSDEAIWRALDQASLKTFVKSLPEGLDTIVGERGVKFSGGQRQRVAIARALYYDPSILVLDEATSALDTETETAVMESIEAMQGNKTLIIVAHRLTTIRKCDKIYEIRNGQAVLRDKEEVLQGIKQ